GGCGSLLAEDEQRPGEVQLHRIAIRKDFPKSPLCNLRVRVEHLPGNRYARCFWSFLH
ncbi:unnamed protein product, partial [Symbiodinium pilosum]